MGTRADRIAKGQCPNCGKEAAPFYLCGDCRQLQRITRCLKRGVRHGMVLAVSGNRYKINDHAPAGADEAWDKWATPYAGSETDRRFRPRLRGIRVDVERTLMEVMRHIGRPCTIEEITAGWGKLRTNRESPLPADLARIIVAEDRRKARNAKRLSATRCQGLAGEI